MITNPSSWLSWITDSVFLGIYLFVVLDVFAMFKTKIKFLILRKKHKQPLR